MLISHLFGAALVEALVTALGFAFIQRNYPQYLTSLRSVVSGSEISEGQAETIPLWRVFAIGIVAAVVLLFLAGLLTGGGRIDHLFGADWSQVSWPDVWVMLAITVAIAIVLIPLAWFLLPKRIKGAGTFFVVIAIIAPLGLIAPGFAFGEGSAEDVKAAFGYIPEGLRQFSDIFSAPFSGYNVQLPFFSDANAPLWHAAIGYEISGIIGVLLIGAVILGIGMLLRRKQVPQDTLEEGSVHA
jgi:cobalt/nickel transport protein